MNVSVWLYSLNEEFLASFLNGEFLSFLVLANVNIFWQGMQFRSRHRPIHLKKSLRKKYFSLVYKLVLSTHNVGDIVRKHIQVWKQSVKSFPMKSLDQPTKHAFCLWSDISSEPKLHNPSTHHHPRQQICAPTANSRGPGADFYAARTPLYSWFHGNEVHF